MKSKWMSLWKDDLRCFISSEAVYSKYIWKKSHIFTTKSTFLLVSLSVSFKCGSFLSICRVNAITLACRWFSPTLTQYAAYLSILPNQSNPQSSTAYRVFHCKHSFPVSTILSCPGSCHQTGCRPLLRLPARRAALSVSRLLTRVPQGLHVWQPVPTLTPALTICLGHAVKSITAGVTLSLCFSLSWMGVSVAALYDYNKTLFKGRSS